jgi:hypothetical protein
VSLNVSPDAAAIRSKPALVQKPAIAPHQEQAEAHIPNAPPAIRAALFPAMYWMAKHRKASAVKIKVDKTAPDDLSDPKMNKTVTLSSVRFPQD